MSESDQDEAEHPLVYSTRQRYALAVIGVLAGLLQLPAGPGAALAGGFGGALLAAIGALFINAALALPKILVRIA